MGMKTTRVRERGHLEAKELTWETNCTGWLLVSTYMKFKVKLDTHLLSVLQMPLKW